MPGILLNSFYQGNRSEYLAHYILSSLGVAVKVPHEEDTGVDFHCVLAKTLKPKLTFGASFVVQVKSLSEKDNLRYGGPNGHGGHKVEELEWLFSQDVPLLIAIADKENHRLDLHPTSNMWSARNLAGMPGEIWFRPGEPADESANIPIPKRTAEDRLKGLGDSALWTVPLGVPLVSLSVKDLEDDSKVSNCRRILEWALRMEQLNITYRNSGVHYSRWPHRIKTNDMSGQIIYGLSCAGSLLPGVLKQQYAALAPLLGVLALNLGIQRQEEMSKQV